MLIAVLTRTQLPQIEKKEEYTFFARLSQACRRSWLSQPDLREKSCNILLRVLCRILLMPRRLCEWEGLISPGQDGTSGGYMSGTTVPML